VTDGLDRLGRFAEAAFVDRPGEAGGGGPRPFVTISRQAGAGGTTLAEALVRAMDREGEGEIWAGWRVLDRAIAAGVARAPMLRVSMEEMMAERYRSGTVEYLTDLLGGGTPQAVILRKVFEIVREAARGGKVVIVGRAGACLTRALGTGVHLRLVASEDSRAGRMSRLLGVPLEEGRRIARAQDRERAALVRDHFGREIDDPLLYDAVWNTDEVPFDEIAAATIRLVRARAAARGPLKEAIGAGPAA
jgi:cytidylate kinase